MKPIIALLLITLLCGCGKPPTQEKREARETLRTEAWGYSVITIGHDGHVFIVADGGHGVSIINHPDCPACKGVER